MKAIIVIDEPNKCGLCPCYDYKHGYCKLTDNHVNPLEKNGKCPLKPMPNKKKPKDPDETWEELHHRFGYNDCLAEILGETE